MSTTGPGPNRLDIAIEQLSDGTIDQSEFLWLRDQIQNNQEARKAYLNACEFESALQDVHFSDVLPSDHRSDRGKPGTHAVIPSKILGRFTPSQVFAAVLALLCVSSAYWYYSRNVAGDAHSHVVQNQSDDQSRMNFAARITNGNEMKFLAETQLEVGSWLQTGEYAIPEGSAEITFDSGVVIKIGNNSKFEIVDSNQVKLLQGTLEASVPEQAIGFKVITPTGEFTDLSTSFSVDVSPTGESDLHVLKGLVEAQLIDRTEANSITVREKSAIRLSKKAAPEPVKFLPKTRFNFGSRSNPNEMNFIHFSFDDQDEMADGIVSNYGSGGEGQGGVLEPSDSRGDAWLAVPGRYNGSLYLTGKTGRIETKINGIEGKRARTVMFWTRIPPDTDSMHAYAIAAWGQVKNGRKWQINWNSNRYEYCGIQGAIRTEFGGGYLVGSTDLRDGRWHHVASVFIGGESTDVSTHVRHYVDGKLEKVSGSKPMRINTDKNRFPLTLGERIGNKKDFAGFKGWIDEFYIFDEALTPSQIVEVMNSNLPPKPSEIVSLPTALTESVSD